jgi:hypothetical protein
VFLEVGANVVEDDDNNGNEVSASKATHVDKTAPTVTYRVDPDKDAQNAVFSLFVTFNETVTGFDANNVMIANVSGDASAMVLSIAGSGPVWRVYISPSGGRHRKN